MKAYIYENKAYPEEKPEPEDFFDVHMPGILDDIIQNTESYKKYLEEWEANGKIVENVFRDPATQDWFWAEKKDDKRSHYMDELIMG